MGLFIDDHHRVPGLTAEAVADAHRRDMDIPGRARPGVPALLDTHMTAITRRAIPALVAIVAIIALGAPVAADETLDEVREATRGFRDVATAQAAGYGILTGMPLEACIDEPGEGAMGFHYVHGDLVGDAVLEPATPEALLYVRRGDGGLRLVGVEYVVFAEAWDEEHAQPPSLFGHEFHLVPEPNRYELPPFYELHAWAWAANPSGTFNDWNPDVSCRVHVPDTSETVAADPTPTGVPFAISVVLAAMLAFVLGRSRIRRRT